MIKPDAVEAGYTGAIIKQIEEAGFRIVAIKKTRLTPERSGQFYAVHNERSFYNDLCTYMSSGTVVPMILEKENAVADFRKLIGATNPAQAEEGTIRKLYAKSIEANAIHGLWLFQNTCRTPGVRTRCIWVSGQRTRSGRAESANGGLSERTVWEYEPSMRSPRRGE